MSQPIEKVSIIVSRGSLDGVYPGLIMANGARMEGMDATLFFTFFGLYAVIDKKMDNIKIATVGNPAMCVPDAMGFGLPTWMGAIPGMSWYATSMMKKEMEKLDVPPVSEFIELFVAGGGNLWACKLAADMFKVKKEDLSEHVKGIITVGEFYEKAGGEGSQIIFT